MPIFDEATTRKLEQLSLVAGRVHVGAMKGERRSRKRGTSIEFADYRDYARGDDLRRLDWNVYARLERPFVKLLEEEEDLTVHLLVDASLSMEWPGVEAETHKLGYALRLAAALGQIALSAGDQLFVTLLQGDSDRSWGPHRGRNSAIRLFRFLETGTPLGRTDLNLSLRKYARLGRRPGLLFLISDLFSPSGYEGGLVALKARGYESAIVQTLSPDEYEPPLGGDVKLVDVETKGETEISLDVATVGRYRRRLGAWQAEIAAFAAARDLHYIPVNTSTPWEKLLMQTLRVRGIVK